MGDFSLNTVIGYHTALTKMEENNLFKKQINLVKILKKKLFTHQLTKEGYFY